MRAATKTTAVLGAVLIMTECIAASAAPFTPDDLAKLSPTAAAELALGGALGPFVEVQPRVPGKWAFGVTLYAKPERTLSICRVFVVRIAFGKPGEGAESTSIGEDRSPKVTTFRSGWYYYFDAPAHIADRSISGVGDVACAGPVGARPVFEAPSLPAALDAVESIQKVAAAANGTEPLPFLLDVQCNFDQSCPDAAAQRARVGDLNPADIIQFTLIGWKHGDTIYQVEFASRGKNVSNWFVRLIYDGPSTERIKKVEMYNDTHLVP